MVLASMVTLVCHSQTPYYTVLNKAKGMPSNSVYDIYQDSRGFIWIASEAGLTRYDGVEFKTYVNKVQTSQAGNQIHEDSYGRVWYKNFDGYLYYVWKDSLYALQQGMLPGNLSYAIIEDQLMFPAEGGIHVLRMSDLKTERIIPMEVRGHVAELQYGDYFYMSMVDTMLRISPSGRVDKFGLEVSGFMQGTPDGIMVAEKGNAKGCFYIATNGRVTKRISTPDIKFIQGIDYNDGIYWLLTPEGAWPFDKEGKRLNGGKPLFPGKQISTIMVDKAGNYWFGTLNEGMYFVPDFDVKLVAKEGFEPNVLCRLDGAVLVGTADNALYRYEPATDRLDELYRADVKHSVRAMLVDSVSGRVVFASQTMYVTDKQYKGVPKHNGAVKEMVQVDGKYVVLAMSGAASLYVLNKELKSKWDGLYERQQTVAGQNDLIGPARAKSVTHDRVHEVVYVAGNTGVYSVTPAGVSEMKRNGERIFAKQVLAHEGVLYIVTPTNRLERYRAGKYEQVYPTGVPEKVLKMKLCAGMFYCLTETGLLRYDNKRGRYDVIETNVVLAETEVKDWEVIGDQLIIATNRGLLREQLEVEREQPLQAKLYLNDVYVDGVKMKREQLDGLDYRQTDVEINYSVLAYGKLSVYRLQYKVNDGQWLYANRAARTLMLASLAPGRYDVRFRLVGGDGRVCDSGALSFRIKQAYWQTWWFWTVLAGMAAVGVVAYYKRQTEQLKKQNALELEKMDLEKNLRTSMLTAIRAQMNPHFFFNALNSIQSYIFMDDKRNASTYLVKMSKLTRMILEMSERERISVREECEALQLYLDLEQVRFGAEFVYDLWVDPELDTEFVMMPSMILQPYIENALKHGLLHRLGPKRLLIKFEIEGSNLLVVIDDNGVGRERAYELRKARPGGHKSFSTVANIRRIELLNRERERKISAIYTDKKNGDGEAEGTTVTITIPLN